MTEIVPCKCGADGWLMIFASLPVKVGVECRKCGNVTKPMLSTEQAILVWNEANKVEGKVKE